jgi:hypothetical protein
MIVVSLGCACGSDASDLGTSARAAGSQVQTTLRGYPRGRWRTASFADLDRTVLWVSHILIRHVGAQSDLSPLRAVGWFPNAVPSTRSESAARALALRVAELAQAHPETFSQLAAQYSEDEPTRARGGSLGPRAASALPAHFLDAIEVMAPGETSQLVSTGLGYHVLLLHNPPPLARVSGRRIVIRYESTTGRGEVTRTRADGLALAQRIAREALAGAPFEQLIERYSEGDDIALGGDLGTWSTREPSLEPSAIEALAQLPLGGVFDGVIESGAGFSILQRTPPRAPTTLGADLALFGFDRANADGALAAARDLIKGAQRDPEAIRRHTGAAATHFVDGHYEPLLTAALRKLALGEVCKTPLQLDGAYAVFRRVASGPRPELPFSYELPTPKVASLTLLDDFVRASQPEQLAYSLSQLSPIVDGMLSGEEKTRVKRIWYELAGAFKVADSPDKRASAYETALASLHGALSETRYAQLTGALQRWVSAELTELDRP